MRTLAIIAAMAITQMGFCETPSDIVDKTVKSIVAFKVSSDVVKASEQDPKFYTLKESVKVSIREVPEVSAPDLSMITVSSSKGLGDALVAIEKIVNIAEKVWNMVVSNKPSVNVDSKYAVALPMGVSSPAQLSNWSKPRSYLLSFGFENLYGMDVINVSYKVTYVYGGNYNGKGKYLAAVWAIPVSVDVMWGFSFNMQAYVPDATVVNVGTTQNPIAALQLKVSWSASSVLKQIDGTGVYYIQGDGYFEELASPFRAKKTNLDNIKLN